MVAETEYEVPTWSQIYDMLLSQARKIRCAGYKPDIVVGIARGGLVPLRILGDLLDTRDLAVITIEYYVGIAQKSREPVLKQYLHTSLTGKKVLLVDDVSDSGRSLQLANKHLEEKGAQQIKVATIYCKPDTLTTAEYYEKETNRWIVFPWEARETLTKIGCGVEGKCAMGREVTNLVRAGFPKGLAERLLKDGGKNP